MSEFEITPSNWRLVEVGRVVSFSNPGPYQNKIAVIVEIIDAKRVLVDGPTEDKADSIPRQAAPIATLSLTPIVMKIPRAIGPGPLAKKWKEAGIDKKWKESAFAQGRARSSKRRTLSDFDRFKVMRLKKQVRNEVRKNLVKIKASS